ncbi:conserved hypothetical protein [Formosa agariphila KMM 3901]|uniref:Uncharacterized protein n=1 Tax=Formosa agariphila (strain DSM 15362 / KCTC 12365 / LMG 23005 / KMM 3901 / M-2Alg 35-1) TaxID=1347342 RepID=T2KRN1_FORAG|nr:hypothetical protein [Formosa agariphila]CDF81121.1 conserved hypothetical protein [Formosa agariphila KMM 3901]
MNKIITLSICLLVITSSFASNFSDLTFSKDGDKSKMEITLTLKDVKAGQKLSIKDEKGVFLFNKTIIESGVFYNRFDLSALPNGTYHFEHEKEHYVKHIPFTVFNGEVDFDSAKATVVYKPSLRVKNNILYLSKLDLNKDVVGVEIYYTPTTDKNYRLLHSEDIKDTVKIERTYRLSGQHKGNYKVVVNANNGETYVEYFKI